MYYTKHQSGSNIAPNKKRKKKEEKKNEEKASSRKGSFFDEGTTDSVELDSINDDRPDDVSPTKSNKSGRPIGNRKAKDLVAKAREDSQFKNDILSVHRDLALQTKTQNNILANQREALTTLADHAVMSTDLISVSEASRPFFEWSQKKVLEKVEKERAEFMKKKKAEEEEEAKKIAIEKRKAGPKINRGRHTRTTKAVDVIESSEEEGEEEEDDEEEEEEQ
ncbi:hypothetical protein Pst134EA_011885 [Puccinia striiformis f. sp. tritici]|uniref:hypothetical protein n=1 Tax=Puccinia striiformis f. sp. tritici TaxID=168172 RepID=UPI0020088EAC|nr:hypothetical protein Pst134EA_011885 [Puccinia striiformis f. sp. tritici]KAH9468261.1 hypothetical protein Pst134EA_011885 [Puccinia striiformis f. sp. tritici]